MDESGVDHCSWHTSATDDSVAKQSDIKHIDWSLDALARSSQPCSSFVFEDKYGIFP
eukprot:m.345728 g.345728  ORF g.345728 m.345728 type:complete len:57 (+) comp27899_c0_seq2:1527-1697(+)